MYHPLFFLKNPNWGPLLSHPEFQGSSQERNSPRFALWARNWTGVGVTWPATVFLPGPLHPGVTEGGGGGMAPAGVNYRSLRPLGRAGYNRSPGWDRDLLTEAVCFSVCPDIQSPMEKVELRAAKRGGQDGLCLHRLGGAGLEGDPTKSMPPVARHWSPYSCLASPPSRGRTRWPPLSRADVVSGSLLNYPPYGQSM